MQPAADFDLTELLVRERRPVAESFATHFRIERLEHFDVDFVTAISEELDEIRHLDTGLLGQAPEFRRERNDADLLVRPVDQAALDRHFLVVGEIVVDADRRVFRFFGAHLADHLEDLLIELRQIGGRNPGRRAQDRGRIGMEVLGAVDVLVLEQELRDRLRFRLGERVVARARLRPVRPPLVREVAVGVEAHQHRRQRHRAAVPILDGAFRQDEIEVAFDVIGHALGHDARIERGLLPGSRRILDPHLQDRAVAINIAGDDAVFLLVLREGTN